VFSFYLFSILFILLLLLSFGFPVFRMFPVPPSNSLRQATRLPGCVSVRRQDPQHRRHEHNAGIMHALPLPLRVAVLSIRISRFRPSNAARVISVHFICSCSRICTYLKLILHTIFETRSAYSQHKVLKIVTCRPIARKRLGKQARNKYATNNRVELFLGNACNIVTQQ
jgi:hypothetical protein